MNLYNLDYNLWLREQISHLKHHRWDALDIQNLVDELEALNKSNKRELYSYLVIVIVSLDFFPQIYENF